MHTQTDCGLTSDVFRQVQSVSVNNVLVETV